MKIGIDMSQTVYEGTGAAMYFKNLAKWLPKIDTRNEYVFFGSSLRRRQPGFWPFPPTMLDFLWNRLHVLPVEWLIGQVDVFHSSDWTQPPTAAKKVSPILDMVVYKYPEFSHPQIVAVQKRRLTWVAREADRVVTISHAAKKDITEILKIPAEKIRIVYLAAGEEFVPQSAPKITVVRKKYNLPRDYILTMGNPGTRKNIESVLAAGKKANIFVAVVGSPGLGFVPQVDMPALYAGAKCFVYPSLYEGFGIPILEAMATGTPVICGRNSSMVEVAGDAATYADIEDVDDLADKIKNVKKTGKEITQAGKFSWEKTARETLKVYEEVV